MQTKSILCCLWISFFAATSSQAQWVEQKIPYFNSALIYAIHPINDMDVWFNTGESRDFQKGFFKTHNGGVTYRRGLIGAPIGSYDATNMSVFNRQVACIGYSGRSFNATPSIVLRTNDGGVSWNDITPPSASSSVFVAATHFFDYHQGLVFSDDNTNAKFTAYTTQNGGVFWNEINSDNLPTRQSGEFSRTLIDFKQDNYWIYVFNFLNRTWRIIHTSNKGASWQTSKSTPDNTFFPASFKFCNDTEGVLIPFDFSLTKPIYKTSDGGMTWTPVKEDPTVSLYFKQSICHVTGTKQTFAATFLRNDTLYSAFTSNFGKSWYGWEFINYSPEQLGRDIAFSSTQKGWVIGGGDGSKTFLWKGNIKAYPEFQEVENEDIMSLRTHKTVLNEDKLTIFPNPTKDFINIEWNKNDNIESVALIDIYGRRVIEQQHPLSNATRFDVQSFNNGFYLIEMKTPNKVLTRKIMIQK